MEYKEIIDISLDINNQTIIYPGNPEVQVEEFAGATSTHSNISLGSHTATHVDAPKHVFKDGGGLETFDLKQFVGPAKVIDASSATEKITIADLDGLDIKAGDRVLFKTKNSTRGFGEFYDDFIYLDGDLADWLVEKKVALVGVDYLSIKQRGGSDNRPHTSLLEHNIVIVEGLDLLKVEAGDYFLVCLPLKLTNIDGAPARAVLLR